VGWGGDVDVGADELTCFMRFRAGNFLSNMTNHKQGMVAVHVLSTRSESELSSPLPAFRIIAHVHAVITDVGGGLAQVIFTTPASLNLPTDPRLVLRQARAEVHDVPRANTFACNELTLTDPLVDGVVQ